MKSGIQNVTPRYTKFENILPDDIIEEDLRNVESFK